MDEEEHQWKWVFIYTLLHRKRSGCLLMVRPSVGSDSLGKKNRWMELEPTVVNLTGLEL